MTIYLLAPGVSSQSNIILVTPFDSSPLIGLIYCTGSTTGVVFGITPVRIYSRVGMKEVGVDEIFLHLGKGIRSALTVITHEIIGHRLDHFAVFIHDSSIFITIVLIE